MKSYRSESTMEALCALFGRSGFPEEYVSNNRLQFTSSQFVHFHCTNGTKHIQSVSYHPLSNAQVERFVQKLKEFLNEEEEYKSKRPDRKSWQAGNTKNGKHEKALY